MRQKLAALRELLERTAPAYAREYRLDYNPRCPFRLSAESDEPPFLLIPLSPYSRPYPPEFAVRIPREC